MATIKDVAAVAGVSFTTVSHVVNNSRPVSADVRAKVERAISQLHYVPSAVARSLKARATATIGLVVPNSTNPYFAELARGIEDGCARNGYCVFFCNSDDDPAKQRSYLRVLQEKRIDGLIVASAGEDAVLAQSLADSREPLVIVDRNIEGLSADLKFRAFPLGDPKILHQRQVCVKEVRAVDLVTTLVAEGCNATGDNRRSKFGGSHAGRGGFEAVLDVCGTAVDGANAGVREERVAITIAGQSSTRSAIRHRKWQPGPEEESAGEGPVCQEIQERIVKLRSVPHVGGVELFANVVVGVSVVVTLEAVRILWEQHAGISPIVKGQEATVGDVVESVAPGEGRL